MSEPPPTCPDWWPKLLWNLHQIYWAGPEPPIHFPGPGPVNYPPAIDNIMANLSIHTFSYLMKDQVAAKEIRRIAEAQLSTAVQNLSKAHDKSLAKK